MRACDRFSRMSMRSRASTTLSLYSSSLQTIMHGHQNYHSSEIRRIQKRSNFTYAGPRKLNDILKTELLQDKSVTEISDLWMTYHEGKDKVHGFVIDGKKGKTLLSRAAQW
jgi:transcriptional accessory protein Tex/SPT6